MTLFSALRERHRGVRRALIVLLAVFLAAGAYLVWPGTTGNKIVAYFTSGSRGGPGKGRNRRGMIMGFHFYQDIERFAGA